MVKQTDRDALKVVFIATYHQFVHSEWVVDQSHLAIIAANIHGYLSQKSAQANRRKHLITLNYQMYCPPVKEGIKNSISNTKSNMKNGLLSIMLQISEFLSPTLFKWKNFTRTF